MSERLIEAIAIAAELSGTMLSKGAAKVMQSDLSRYPEQQVLAALSRCRRELRGRLTIADVVSRLDDGRPGVEEAWAMIPRSEADTVVWTDEMAVAMDVVHPLLDAGDAIGARMAFKERYQGLLQKARDASSPVRWSVSLGHDKSGREGPIRNAIDAGRLSADELPRLLPNHSVHPTMAKLLPGMK